MCCPNVRDQICPDYESLPSKFWLDQIPIDEPNFNGICVRDGKCNSQLRDIGVTMGWTFGLAQAQQCTQVLILGNDNIRPNNPHDPHPADCCGYDNGAIRPGENFIQERGIYFIADIVDVINLNTFARATNGFDVATPGLLSDDIDKINKIKEHHCNWIFPLRIGTDGNYVAPPRNVIFFNNPTEQRCFSAYITFQALPFGYINCP